MASLCRTFTWSPTFATASPGATLKRLPPDSETFPASNIGRIFRYVGSADVELPEGDHLGLILELSSVLGSNPAAEEASPNVFGTNFFGVKMIGGEFFISRPEVEDLKLDEISFEKLFVVVDVNVFSDDDVKDFDSALVRPAVVELR